MNRTARRTTRFCSRNVIPSFTPTHELIYAKSSSVSSHPRRWYILTGELSFSFLILVTPRPLPPPPPLLPKGRLFSPPRGVDVAKALVGSLDLIGVSSTTVAAAVAAEKVFVFALCNGVSAKVKPGEEGRRSAVVVGAAPLLPERLQRGVGGTRYCCCFCS